MISLIVAVSDDWGIGKDNELLWHISADLKRFKALTTGKTVVMGKKTWESLPGKPLPGRKNVVITDNPADTFGGAVVAYSIADAVEKCGNDEVFIIGGGSIYKQFMPLADRLLVTHVHMKAPADVYFPEISGEEWTVEEKEDLTEPEKGIPYTYTVYVRKE